MSLKYIQLIFIIIFLSSCSNPRSEKILLRAEMLSETVPWQAIRLLDSIPNNSLKESDRRLRELLLVKAYDKAFCEHTSDSLIISALDFYRKHSNSSRYTEALYYAGRVYHDLGDFPTAVSYYQQALDRLSANDGDIRFRGKVLCQLGFLLNSLRLYDQAVIMLKEALTIDSICRDTVFWIDDLLLLGNINLNKKEYLSARQNFYQSRRLAASYAPTDTSKIDIDLAAASFHQRDIPTALRLIRSSLFSIDSLYKSYALSYAAMIYMEAGYPDSAANYARQLILSPDTVSRRTGYRILLSPALRGKLSPDSVASLALDYSMATEAILNRQGRQETLLQNTRYNYETHKRERMKAEAREIRVRMWFFTAIAGILICLLIIGLLRYRYKTTILRMREILSELRQMRFSSQNNNGIGNIESDLYPLNKAELKGMIEQQIRDIDIVESSYSVPDTILCSEAYMQLQEYLKLEKPVVETNQLWKDIENTVALVSPQFRKRWMTLTGGNLKEEFYHIALLIKCGVTPSQLTVLISKEKSTITYRRKIIGKSMFQDGIAPRTVDAIIRLL